MKIMKMSICEWEIFIKLILGTAWVSTRFAVHIENGENGCCEMLVNLHVPTLGHRRP